MPLRKLNKRKAHQAYKTADGTRVPGSSTVSKIEPQSPHLMRWAHQCGLRGENIDEVRNFAAEVGSSAHFLIETFLSGDTADLSDFSGNVIEKANNAFDNFLRWWDKNGYAHYRSEVGYVSEKYGYGGTLDELCYSKSNKFMLLDFKVVNSGPHMSHISQLSSYENLANEHEERLIDERAILIIPKEKDHDVGEYWQTRQDIDAHFNVFKCQLLSFKAIKALKKK